MENQVNQTEEKVVKKKSYVPFIIIAAVIFVIIFLVIAIIQSISIISGSDEKKLQEQLDLGERYLQELAYEQAIVAYTAAIEIDPKSVDAYLGLADAYLGLGDVNMALDVLQDGYDETGDESLLDKMDEINESLQTSEEDSQDVAESDEADWLTNGIPRSNIKDISEFTIGGVYLPYLTPNQLLEMYGEYDNLDYDENSAKLTGEIATYEVSDFAGTGDHYQYSLYKYYEDCSWCLHAEKRTGWESVSVTGENCEIGFADIYFGDDYDTVMNKLGFTQEQADWVKEGIGSGDTNLWYCPTCDPLVFDKNQFSYFSGIYGIGMTSFNPDFAGNGDRGIILYFDENFKLTSVSWARNVFPEE